LFEKLKALRFLNMVINETLRLYPAVPSELPRRVPDGGAALGGFYFPGGVTVTTQAYSLHRDGVAFPNAEEFIPTRWDMETKEMKEAFMPFGGGSRGESIYTCVASLLIAYCFLQGGTVLICVWQSASAFSSPAWSFASRLRISSALFQTR
jgi:hypothetical protein